MEQFFQSYGSWILFGVMFLVMFAMHGLGIGHGGRGRGSGPPEGAASNQDQEGSKGGPPGCH